jgi:dipeptidyl aminopeptidase/acylaminoacyl peptidase
VVETSSPGDARQVTFVPEGASSPVWSPDGSHIAFIGTVIGDPEAVVDDPRPPENREQLRRSPVARIARRLDYKHDGQGFVDGRYHHLFVVPAAGGDVTQLTNGAWDVTGFDWSPDGDKLVIAGNAEPNSDLQRALNLYVVDLGGKRSKLVGGYYLGSPSWSPRGDLIAFIAPNGLDAGLLERLWIVPSGGGDQRCLTIGLDQSVSDSLITDMRAGHGARLTWSKEGDRVYFLSSGPGISSVYSCDLEGNVRSEVGGQRRIFDFDNASGVIAFCASDISSPGELHMLTQGAEARITDLNPWLRDRYIAQPERHTFTAPDGWVLEGWVLRPENFDPNRRYPLVLEIHGGPHGQYGWAFFHELQILAGMGYIVLCINPRGSDGYGEHFRRQVVRDWGGKDYFDLMSALDQAIERTGNVDARRMGVGGGSYGGYMTNWIIGQTNRFAAAVAMRSLSNLVSEYAQHDIVLWGALELGPPPWPDLDELWRRSPIRYVQNIVTPLLLTCGEMDLRCAISQSEELFGAMRFLGKTVEMVRFPEESHDLSRIGRPDRRVERLNRIAGWFERFLGTESSDKVSEAETQVLPARRHDAEETLVLATSPAVVETMRMPAPPAEDLEATALLETIRAPEQLAPDVEPAAFLETLRQAEPPASVAPETPPVPEPVAEAAPPEVQPETEPAPEAPKEADILPVFPEPDTVFPQPATVPPEPAAEVPPEPPASEPAPIEAAAHEPTTPPPAPEPTTPPPAAAPTPAASVTSTMLSWPTTSIPGAQENGQAETGEAATTIIPAWQPAEMPSESRRTISLSAMPREAVAAGEPFAAKLSFESGPFAGRVVALPSQMVTVGRAPDNDVVVGDPATSGRHGRIELRAGVFWISDLGSTNGTMVNGEPVIEKQLSDGDVIAIGQNTIRFTIE